MKSIESKFYCCKCGNEGIPIRRKNSKLRESGHLKKLYCLNCKKEVNMVECKEFTTYTKEDFLLEFKYNNFDENQNRILKYGEFKNKLIKEGVLY